MNDYERGLNDGIAIAETLVTWFLGSQQQEAQRQVDRMKAHFLRGPEQMELPYERSYTPKQDNRATSR